MSGSAGRLDFPPSPMVLRQLRADVRAAAARLGADGAVCDTVALVVDELVNNAIEHGADYRRRGLDLAVQVGLRAGRVQVEFFDREMPDEAVGDLAQALGEAAGGLPALDSERGRGLFLLSVYLEDLSAEVATGGGLRLSGVVAAR
ncbi:MAG: ATP-binding protein [Planctomycetes bacterium]|nr:ATP-binding protein [Planctomycetota bacterium]